MCHAISRVPVVSFLQRHDWSRAVRQVEPRRVLMESERVGPVCVAASCTLQHSCWVTDVRVLKLPIFVMTSAARAFGI